jgi:DNA-binding NarL/FixJ family response regulator
VSRKAPNVPRPDERTRVLLIDDHPLVRERLAEVIHREPDLVICGAAEDRHQALTAIAAAAPDLAIVDLVLKNSDGLELIKDIHARWPKLGMLVVSMHDESLYAERVLRAGARGYITKQEATRNILRAIRRVLQGDIYLNDRIATQILSRLTTPDPAPAVSPVALLTDRELQVFEMTGHGLGIRQIAGRLRLAVKTVETYRGRIREKLKLRDAEEMLQRAIAWVHRT